MGEESSFPFLPPGEQGFVSLLSEKRTFLLLIYGVGLFWNTSFFFVQGCFVAVTLQSLPFKLLGGDRSFRDQLEVLGEFYQPSQLKLVKGTGVTALVVGEKVIWLHHWESGGFLYLSF